MFSRLSIRARITVGSVLVAAVLFSVALFVVRAQVGTILSDADVTLAEGDLTSFEQDILANPDESVDDPGTGVLVFVRSPSGEVQVDSLPRDVHSAIEHRTPANEQFTMGDDDGRSFVVVGRIVESSAGDWTLWAARSASASTIALHGFDDVLVIGGLVLLAGFGLASWLLATAALRPVARLRTEAEKLGAESADGALPVGPARDEIAELATTLNEFIARVRAGTEREKQMVSDAAHELRTPLAALKTQLELAHGDFGNAQALASEVVAAEASVDRLSSLATNLLELSRLGAPDATTRSSRTEVLVTELMGSVDRARMLGLAKHADIAFAIDSAPDDARYAVDPDSFGRLCDNLFANAIAAIPKNGSVTASLTERNDHLEFEVADSGPGMPPAFLDRAFDRFSRPDDSRTSSTGGSGLGLALVKAIATSAGGDATLRNGDPGLVITITIPKM
jgi:signal transduction histidine kinase